MAQNEQLLAQTANGNDTRYDFNDLESDTSRTTGGIHNSVSHNQDVGINFGNQTKAKTSNKAKGAYLSFDHITLSINDSNKEKGGSDRKFILNDVNGEAFPNQLMGIIGASGGGKTTLLSMISGRLFRIESLASKSETSGDIYLNKTHVDCSRKGDFNFLRESIGFVLQEDLLFETEKAGEAIEASAKLRLNKKFDNRLLTKEEKLQRAERIIKELDLWKSRNTKIGGQTIRGLSGGERKRVSIGVELVTDPNILFLDEPTSGLDSAIAYQTMLLLKNLAKNGKTVICSLHQPSSEIFNLIDRVMVLAKGKVVYHGYVHDLAMYLSNFTGYECPQYSNIADFILQQVHEQPDYFIEKWNEYMSKSNEISFIPENADLYSKQELMEPKIYRKESHDYMMQIEKAKMAPICDQISVLFKRQFVIFVRNPIPTYVRFGQTIFTALLQGALWWQMPSLTNDDSQTNIGNRFGGIFYAISFAAMNAVMAANLTFPSQRAVFQKERAGNWYYTIPFLIGKTCLDLPLAWLVMLPFAIVIRYMCNFHTQWYEIYFTLALVASVADSMGFFIGCVANRPEIAIQLTPLTIIPLFLFSGFFISVSSIPVWIRWIQWIDCFYYGTDMFRIFEFEQLKDIDRESWDSLDLNEDNVMRDIYCLIALFAGLRILAIFFLIKRNGF